MSAKRLLLWGRDGFRMGPGGPVAGPFCISTLSTSYPAWPALRRDRISSLQRAATRTFVSARWESTRSISPSSMKGKTSRWSAISNFRLSRPSRSQASIVLVTPAPLSFVAHASRLNSSATSSNGTVLGISEKRILAKSRSPNSLTTATTAWKDAEYFWSSRSKQMASKAAEITGGIARHVARHRGMAAFGRRFNRSMAAPAPNAASQAKSELAGIRRREPKQNEGPPPGCAQTLKLSQPVKRIRFE